MPELNLNKRREERQKDQNLGVIIGEKTYYIPLGKSLKVKELSKLSEQAEVMKFFEKHLGKEVMDSLSVDDFEAIVEAWSKATQSGELFRGAPSIRLYGMSARTAHLPKISASRQDGKLPSKQMRSWQTYMISCRSSIKIYVIQRRRLSLILVPGISQKISGSVRARCPSTNSAIG